MAQLTIGKRMEKGTTRPDIDGQTVRKPNGQVGCILVRTGSFSAAGRDELQGARSILLIKK